MLMKESTWENVIKEAMPSVVTVVISKKLEAVEKEIPHDSLPFFPFEHSKNEIPDGAIDAHGMVQIGSGSGFAVDSKGIILTNKHVVADKDAEYTVITNDNKKYRGYVLARDPIDDVAILKIHNHEPLKTLDLGDSSNLNLGQPILAIGNALGLFKDTVSLGIVSGLSRSITASPDQASGTQEMRGLIQTDAAINPGNSGGPLIDSNGSVIGINTAIVFGAQNLSFAIPINSAKRDVEDLKKFGRIKRPMLGLRYITIDENLKEKMNLPVDYGALVISQSANEPAVIKDSPADKAGLREKDIVLEINNEKVTRERNIQDFLEEKEVGDTITLKIRRNLQEMQQRIMLTERI